jgi:hypothetical protein
MNKTELNNLKKVIAVKYKEMEDMQNNLFKQMTTAMFDSIPELKSVSFTGYTPSFNDGDACNFSCQTKYPCVNGYDSNGDEITPNKKTATECRRNMTSIGIAQNYNTNEPSRRFSFI